VKHLFYLNHYYDNYEILVDGSKILRITKRLADSGIIRDLDFADLPEGLQDEVIRGMGEFEYEI